MLETFEKILVKDDRLGCITPKVKFQVFKGGQNVTCQPYKAISVTTADHVYNVTVPSLETIISREVLWQSTVTFRISNPNKSANDFAINYGVTDALAPFPATQPDQRHVVHEQQQYRQSERTRVAAAPPVYGGSRGVLQIRLHDADSIGLLSKLRGRRQEARVPDRRDGAGRRCAKPSYCLLSW